MPEHRERRAIARLSIEYVACLLSEGMADTGLDILDFVIVLVVSASNIGHLKARHEGSEAPIPADQMAPVTPQGIAESLKLPSEVAEARIASLVGRGILLSCGDCGVIMGEPVTSSDVAGNLAEKNIAMARRFARQLADLELAA
ncbi:MAG TPA: hypothetical protein VGI95_07770 [Caulobacteraceae bacterium]